MYVALLDYLRATLPPPLYSFALSAFSYANSAASAFITLATSLLENPSEWRAEAIVPPIITILAAYLALMSLYRTASWAVRLSLFFLKWGTLIGVAMAVAGYLAGKGTDAAAGQSMANVFSSMLGGGTSSKHKRQTNHRRSQTPKPWNSFTEWQYQEQPDDLGMNPNAHQLMNSIVRVAEGALGGKWWSAAIATKETQSRGKNGKTRSR